MKFISEQDIIQSWMNLIESNENNSSQLNKFFGLLDVIKKLNIGANSKITAGNQYHLNSNELSNELQEKYFFGNDLKEFNNSDLLYVIFPKNWEENVFNSFLKSKTVSLKDTSIIALQHKSFDESQTSSKLKKDFLEAYHLSNVSATFFQDDKTEIKFQKTKPNRANIIRELKRKYRITDNSKFTFGFEKSLVAANPGEITRGPFIQPLYSGQENLKCVLLSSFDFLDKYKIIESENKIEVPVNTSSESLNRILYGPPGTGKTYISINHAVSIIKGNDLTGMTRIQVKNEFDKLVERGQIQFITFHQSYSYEEFVEGIKPRVNDNGEIEYAIQDGIFKKICVEAGKATSFFIKIEGVKKELTKQLFEDFYYELSESLPDQSEESSNVKLKTKEGYEFQLFKNSMKSIVVKAGAKQTPSSVSCNELTKVLFENKIPVYKSYETIVIEEILKEKDFEKIEIDNLKKPFVLIIDEINRGNISKIFGELITLIEDSKRLGNAEALKVRLTYSGINDKEMFGVPSNLHIIGTMNSADRSIALIDTALRRRFTFTEYTSDPSILSDNIDGINLKLMLQKLNERIEFLLDKDHLLGHAYFIDVKTKNDLCGVFRNKILPLLEEYFFGNYEKIQQILGDNSGWKKTDQQKLVQEKKANTTTTLFGNTEDFEDKIIYQINPKLVEGKFDEITPDVFTSIYTKK